MTITEDGVFSHIPIDLRRPVDVPADGKAGVSQESFDTLVRMSKNEFAARLVRAGADPLSDHELLQDAACMQVAARVLRRIRAFQEVADGLFADSNVTFRLYLETVENTTEDGTSAESVVIDEEGYDALDTPWRPDPNDFTYGFNDRRG